MPVLRAGVAPFAILVLLFVGACAGGGSGDVGIIDASDSFYELPTRSTGSTVQPIEVGTGRGFLVLEGGGVMSAEVAATIVAHAGPNPRLCLIDTADQTGGQLHRFFDGFAGLRLVVFDLEAADVGRPDVLQALSTCTGYFFGGGSPRRLSEILRPGGRASPALTVIRDRFEHHGAVFSGSSAGAMIVSPVTLCECAAGSSVAALLRGELFRAPGFDMVGPILVDAHFLARGLIGRHLVALARTGLRVGVGVDESAALVVPGDGGAWRIIGDGQVALIGAPDDASEFDLRGFSLTLLSPGDRWDPQRKTISFAPDRHKIDSGPRSAAAWERDDAFGPGRIPRLLRELVTGEASAVNVTAAGGAIIVRLAVTPKTAAYSDGQDMSITAIALEIERL